MADWVVLRSRFRCRTVQDRAQKNIRIMARYFAFFGGTGKMAKAGPKRGPNRASDISGLAVLVTSSDNEYLQLKFQSCLIKYHYLVAHGISSQRRHIPPNHVLSWAQVQQVKLTKNMINLDIVHYLMY